MPKSNPANGFAAQSLRTVAHDADGSGNGNAPTVRANPLKTNAGTAADGADANARPNLRRKKQGSGLECAAMSAVEALKAARAAGVELALDGDDLVLEAASAPPAAVLDATVASQGRDRGAASARPRRLVGRGLAGLL